MAKKKRALPFDKQGGVVAIQRRLLSSQAYLQLKPQTKVLMTLMHTHWSVHGPVAYGVREAMEKIPCAKGTAQNAFRELQEAGFIVMIDESLFDSRTQSKSRTWRLTWMPDWNNRAPTNDWEKAS